MRNKVSERSTKFLGGRPEHREGDDSFKLLLSCCSVVFDSLWPHGLHHARLPCPSPCPRAWSNSCPLSWWCLPTISPFVIPFSSCLQSFPATGSFLVSQFLHQMAKVLEFQLQHQSFQWIFRTDLLVWSPCSPRDSQESSPTSQFKSISSSVFSLLYGPTLTSIDDYWKIIALTVQILLVMKCLCFLLCCLGLS